MTALCFDIGSNIGAWTLANINTYEKIISVEADPITYQRLITNCTDSKIICLNFAVCDNDGNDITFFQCEANTLSTLNKDWLTDKKSRFYNTKYNEIICKTITLDFLINKYGKPNLIKMDVEGGEYECIKSLTQKVDQLCFEWASELADITFKCLDHLYNIGFTKFYIQNGDNYTFRPTEYTSIENVKLQLSRTIPKKDWGMIWCV